MILNSFINSGTFNVESKFRSNGALVLGSKVDKSIFMAADTPGPGAYSQITKLSKTRGVM